MSTIISSRVWRMQLPPVPKFVYVSLADQANDQAVCWPSIDTLARRTGYSIRAVQNAIKWLKEQGLLDVEIGAMKANRYTLRTDRYKPPAAPVPDPLDAEEMPPDPAPGAPMHDVHPRTTCTPPPQEVHPNRKRTVSNTPPVSPKGEQPSPAPAQPELQTSGRKRRVVEGLTLAQWLDELRARGEKPIPPDHSIFDYAETVGLSEGLLTLHWRVFKSRFIDSNKTQRDWRLKLLNSVRGNWYRLWYHNGQGRMVVSTVGTQAALEWGVQL
jgi:biotin operon repressor